MSLRALTQGDLSGAFGILPVSKGGTGSASFPVGQILFGNGAAPVSSSANHTWNTGTNTLLVGGSPGVIAGIDVSSGSVAPSALTVRGGDSTGSNTQNGGALVLRGGNTTGISGGNGANVNLSGGNATSGTLGGTVFIAAGSGMNNGQVVARNALAHNLIIIQDDGSGLDQMGFFGVGATYQPAAAVALDVGLANLGLRVSGSPGAFNLDFTNTATVGNVTINKPSGTVNIAALASGLTLTNSLITANSRIELTMSSDPGVALSIWATGGAGSAVIGTRPAVVNQTAVDFLVIN